MAHYLRDTDQTEQELLKELFDILEYENTGKLTVNKLTLLAKDKFDIHISEEEAKEMIQALGIKAGKPKDQLIKRYCQI